MKLTARRERAPVEASLPRARRSICLGGATRATRDDKATEDALLLGPLGFRGADLHAVKGAVRAAPDLTTSADLLRDATTVYNVLKALREKPGDPMKDTFQEVFNTGGAGAADNDKRRFQVPIGWAVKSLRNGGHGDAADALQRIQAAVEDAVAVDPCCAGRVCSDMVLLISDPGCGAQQPHVDVPRLVGEELSAPNVALGAVFSLSPGGSRFDVALGTMGVQDRSRSRALRVVGTEAGPGGRVPRRRDAPRGGVRGVQPPHPRLSQHN